MRVVAQCGIPDGMVVTSGCLIAGLAGILLRVVSKSMAAMCGNGEQEKLWAQNIPIITLMMSVVQQRRVAGIDCNGE
jgi:hypothetical protein